MASLVVLVDLSVHRLSSASEVLNLTWVAGNLFARAKVVNNEEQDHLKGSKELRLLKARYPLTSTLLTFAIKLFSEFPQLSRVAQDWGSKVASNLVDLEGGSLH